MKTHLHDSEIPANEGSTLTAICGADVRDSAFVFLWENGNITDVKPLYVCKKCAIQLATIKRYIYGITEAQNLQAGQRRE